ncbi:hypothetical protein N9901_02395 [Flavobacteriaceae bacterium]|nr:hypothetical protein [Flavobacteriaceae bacterium]
MKLLLSTLTVLMFSINTQAQFLNKLKSRIAKEITKEVLQKENKSTPPQEIETSSLLKTSGTAQINHNNKLGQLTISKISKSKTHLTNGKIEFSANWNTHDVDIADGVFITIIDKDLITNSLSSFPETTYTLYANDDDVNDKGAVMSIAYDPNKTLRSPSKDYQNYYLTNGNVTIKQLDGNKFSATFKGTPLDKYNSIKNLAKFVDGTLNISNVTVSKNFMKVKENNSNNTSNEYLDGIKEQMNTPQIEGVYNFDKEVICEIKNGRERTILNLLQTTNNSYYAIAMNTDEGTMVMIFDGDTSLNLLETNGQKIQMPSAMNQSFQNPLDQTAEITSNLQKTGKQKNILGYVAHQYLMKNKDSEIELWATPELNMDSFIKTPNKDIGFVLQSTYKTNGQLVSYKVQKLNNKQQSFNSKEYRSMMSMF